jgi:hypothetical protein
MTFDAVIKLAHPAFVIEATVRLGFPDELTPALGALIAVLVTLYLVPRTALLGAALLTGYLGGAVCVHLRIGDPVFSHTLFPVYVGALFWLGLALRDARVRQLLVG